jgi:hypothetical protein
LKRWRRTDADQGDGSSVETTMRGLKPKNGLTAAKVAHRLRIETTPATLSTHGSSIEMTMGGLKQWKTSTTGSSYNETMRGLKRHNEVRELISHY